METIVRTNELILGENPFAEILSNLRSMLIYPTFLPLSGNTTVIALQTVIAVQFYR